MWTGVKWITWSWTRPQEHQMSTCPSCSTSVPPTSTALSSSPPPRYEPKFHWGSIMAVKGSPWVTGCWFHRNLRVQNLREMTSLCCACSWLVCGLGGCLSVAGWGSKWVTKPQQFTIKSCCDLCGERKCSVSLPPSESEFTSLWICNLLTNGLTIRRMSLSSFVFKW